MLSKLMDGQVQAFTPVAGVLHGEFSKVYMNDSLGRLARLLKKQRSAVVLQTQNMFLGNGQTATKDIIVGIVTQEELLSYITKNERQHHKSDEEDEQYQSSKMLAIMETDPTYHRQKTDKWYKRKASIVSNFSQMFVKSSATPSEVPLVE
ncbi:uncharacterized protein LOC122385275 [Amphibalanus amphitrite]|uniref:uncharacterized protein LOC122385275 n=1 Tax=Amphibalanus amphitrite TaxID=1232801 RepID=UPI001C8FF88A|nr:uncharacterized protein LOC122385275 [Amphibalanus amphitrite]